MKDVSRIFVAGIKHLDPDLMNEVSRFDERLEEGPWWAPYLCEDHVREVLLDAYGEACIAIIMIASEAAKADMSKSLQRVQARRRTIVAIGYKLLGPHWLEKRP